MKKILGLCLSLLLILSVTGCGLAAPKKQAIKEANPIKVILGEEREELYAKRLEGKRVGIITNQTGVDSKLQSIVDRFIGKYNVTGIFVPEHGFFGAVKAGDDISDEMYRGIKVYSVYGKTRRLTQEMLDTFDVVVVDLQDVGARHYTYVSTMAYAMEAVAKAKKEIIVMDRPNPLGGKMQGPVLKEGLESFIGLYHVPLRHGLTIGEFAKFINKEYKINANLFVVPMEGWTRSMYWEDTGLPWVGTSPLIPTADTTKYYIITGFVGDTGINNGVGTAKPFYYVGETYVNQIQLAEKLNSMKMPGVYFRAMAYAPRYGSLTDKIVKGVELYVTDRETYNPAEIGFNIVRAFEELYPNNEIPYPERYGGKGHSIDIAFGEKSLRTELPASSAFPRWEEENKTFAKKVKPYLLYK